MLWLTDGSGQALTRLTVTPDSLMMTNMGSAPPAAIESHGTKAGHQTRMAIGKEKGGRLGMDGHRRQRTMVDGEVVLAADGVEEGEEMPSAYNNEREPPSHSHVLLLDEGQQLNAIAVLLALTSREAWPGRRKGMVSWRGARGDRCPAGEAAIAQ